MGFLKNARRQVKRQLMRKNNAELLCRQVDADIREKTALESTENLMYIAMLVLHDKFGFGKERLTRFYEGMSTHSECINKDLVSMGEIKKIINGELGLAVKVK